MTTISLLFFKELLYSIRYQEKKNDLSLMHTLLEKEHVILNVFKEKLERMSDSTLNAIFLMMCLMYSIPLAKIYMDPLRYA